MKKLIFVLCSCFIPLAAQAALIPTIELSHENAFKNFKLSPDGGAIVYSETIKGENVLRILNLDTGKKIGIDLMGYKKAWYHDSHVFWVNNDRLIYSFSGGYEAINRDGTKARGIGGNIRGLGAIMRNLRFSEEGKLLVTTMGLTTKGTGPYSSARYDTYHPGVAKIDTATGATVIVEINPGNVFSWLSTSDGEIPVAVEMKGTRFRVVHRMFAQGEWNVLPGMDWDDPQVLPLGFGENNQVLYVSRLNEKGYWAVYPYDLVKNTFGPVILQDDNYDIIPGMDNSSQDGVIYSPDDRRLLGIRYVTAYPRVYWLDQGLAQVQVGLDQALEGKVNDITSMSDDLQKLIVHSWSDRDPGSYYLFDREKQSLSLLMESTPWIKEEQMSKMRPIKIEARDGITLQGYMTLPIGKKAKALPLIVLQDTNFWIRATWTFDRTVQFYANRGYAVLEMNPRGSTGYGDAFKKMGYRNTEGARADIADAVKWAISKGLVDAKRVAVVGDGGMSSLNALMLLAEYPDLFACGVASSPDTDWKEVITLGSYTDYDLAFLHERLGDPKDPTDPLSRRSPLQLVDQIKAPVLITLSDVDKLLRYSANRKMVKALKASGSVVTIETKYDEKYGFENRAKWFEDTVAFISKYMPADQ